MQTNIQLVNANYTYSSAWPYLTVNYAPLSGLERTATYQRQRLNGATDLSVNVANGMAVLHAHDLSIAGTGITLSVDRYLNNSGAQATGQLGVGWSTGFGRDVLAYLWGDGTVSYRDPTGYWTPFFPDGSGGYTTYTGMDATLKLTSAPNNFSLTFHSSGLAEPDGDRGGDPHAAMPGAADRGCRHTGARGSGMGSGAECGEGDSELAVHDGQGTHQAHASLPRHPVR